MIKETSISVNKHIYNILINDEILNEMVDKKIYPNYYDDDIEKILENTNNYIDNK